MIRLRCFLFLVTAWFSVSSVWAIPASGVFRVTGSGDLARSYWRFKAGDHAAWANPAYNDAHWLTGLSPDQPLRQNETLWASGKGWFRLRFQLTKKKLGEINTLSIDQMGWSEVYLDGHLLATVGTSMLDTAGADQASQHVVRYVPLPVSDTNQHILAVRYAIRRDPVLVANFEEAAFKLLFTPANEAPVSMIVTEKLKASVSFLLAGVFSILALLHFLFYRANKIQQINKLLGWEMAAFAVGFAAPQLDDFVSTLTANSLLDLISSFGLMAGLLLLLTVIYHYLALKRGWVFYVVVGLTVLSFLYEVIFGPVPYELDSVCLLLLVAEYTRISWIGRKRKDDDSRLPWVSLRTAFYCLLALIVTGVVAGIVVAVTTKSANVNINLGWFAGVVFLIMLLGLLSFPVGLSLSLVRDYARTYRTLANKLQEVEALSAKTVAQEQEKQQLLARQNETLEHLVSERTAALDQSLTDLRATQDQLIQREKLASLGELTAGVAHEIQNPLNFVNNFSDVSVDLLTELEEEQARPAEERDPGLEQEILADVKQNIGKISHHGQRAASIVRCMLQHSRTSTGQREPTDLNALADEYLRLAYHGLRAREKTFEVSLVTQFDPTLPGVSTVPQDIGRVLMNLFTNAFYAVQERTWQATGQSGTYRPTVTVTTAQTAKGVQIHVLDNGTGIPDEVRSKIFQPFFTTKPTGKGTGLGLSLSYDIITKGHGGSIDLHTKPGTGTEFVLTLPVT
ncbi:sensor histidine kinase [Fibrella arboris]|uniref:sensor histidine kinase n=1 Tax=Fibrella arboris TaxID=3242486 RepID=UPI00352045A8